MRVIARFTLFFLSLLLVLGSGFCVGIGVSPGSIELDNILRGGYAEAPFYIANPNDLPVNVSVWVDGDVNEWTEAVGADFVEANDVGQYKLVFTPSNDIPVGDYECKIYISAESNTEVSGGTGSVLSVGSIIPVYLNINDEQIQKPVLKKFNLEENEECKPVHVNIMLENKGNVRVKPRYDFDLYTKNGSFVKDFTRTASDLLPGQDRTDSFILNTKLQEIKCIPDGEYTLTLNFYDDGAIVASSEKEFKIYPSGTFSIQGDLLNIDYDRSVSKGSLVKVVATFENIGESAINAKLKGEIYKEEELLDVFESDEYTIGVGDTSELEAYFKPDVSGELTLKTWVQFEGKKTTEFEGPLKVSSSIIYIYAVVGVVALAVAGYFVYNKFVKGGKKRKKK